MKQDFQTDSMTFSLPQLPVCNVVVVRVNCFQEILCGVGLETRESTEDLFTSVSVPFQQLFLDPSEKGIRNSIVVNH